MKGMRTATFLTFSLALSACSGIYETNTFAALEVGASEPDISGMLRKSRLDDLTVTLHELSTYEDLSPTEVADVEAFLAGLITDPSDPRTRAAAAESLSAIRVNTTPAGAAIQAFSRGFILLISGTNEETDPTSLLQTLIPAEATSSESAFEDFIATLYELRDIHGVVNNALQDPRVELTSTGDVFQAAFVTYLLTSTIDAIDPDDDGIPDEPREAKTAMLYSALTDGDGSLELIESALSAFSVETAAANASDPGSGIDVILATSGLAPLVAGLVPELGTTSDGG